MRTPNLTLVLAAWLVVSFTPTLNAQNNIVTYQGRVQSGGANFTGTGQFKFALEMNTGRPPKGACKQELTGRRCNVSCVGSL